MSGHELFFGVLGFLNFCSASFGQFAQITQQMGAEGQVAVKFGDMIDYLGDKLGVPASLRNSAAERAFAIEQQQAQQAQAMAAQMAMQQQGMAPPGQPALPAPMGAPA